MKQKAERPLGWKNWTSPTREKWGRRWFWFACIYLVPEWICEWVIWVYKRSQLLKVATVGFGLFGIGVYLIEIPVRKSQALQSAQSMITLAGPTKRGTERRKALEFLVKNEVLLQGLDLSEWDFGYEKELLVGLDLTDENLSGARLDAANLNRARLSGANFSGASLRGADFSEAWLSGAVLTGADLTRADLTSAVGLTFDQVRSAWWGKRHSGWRGEVGGSPRLSERLQAQLKLNQDAGNFESFTHEFWEEGSDCMRWKPGAKVIELPKDWKPK